MVATDRVRDIFSDVRAIHSSALERLDAGDIRDAAEKAWCAVKRATDALVLARTGVEPERTPDTGSGLRELASADPRVRELRLVGRYYHVQGQLHGDCFYLSRCQPEEDGPLIRDVARYIGDAEDLAGAQR